MPCNMPCSNLTDDPSICIMMHDCQCLGIDELGQVAGSGAGLLNAVENLQKVDQALFKARQ